MPRRMSDSAPFDVTPGSNKKVWWICRKNHEWPAQIKDRKNGSGCPFCWGTRPGPDNDLAFKKPDLAKEWHSVRNGDLTAYQVTPYSSKKVWWKCLQGHEWPATVANRTAGYGCPYCAGKKTTPDNNLAVKFPELAAEWHPTKNNKLTPYDVMPGSNRKIWWQCKRGHPWLAMPLDRTSKSSGCPKCKPQTSRPEIRVFCELKTILDGVKWNQILQGIYCDIYLSCHGIVIEYDGHYRHRGREESDEQKEQRLAEIGVSLFRIREHGLRTLSETDIVLDPKEVDLSVMRKLLNKLLRYHEFSPEDRRSISDYLASNRLLNDNEFKEKISLLPGPPINRSLASLYPEIAREWDSLRNSPLEPTMFTPGSNERMWWRCRNGHEWPAPIYHRAMGSGCPYCSGNKAADDNNLAVENPALAKEWHPTENGDLTAFDVTPGSDRKVWWKCAQGHEWPAVIENRAIQGSGCSYCLGRRASKDNNLALRFPELAAEWHPKRNGDLSPDAVVPGSQRKVWWKCKNDHEWRAVIKSRKNGSGCPHCAGLLPTADNNLSVKFPEIARQWHRERRTEIFPPVTCPPTAIKKDGGYASTVTNGRLQ